MDQAAKIELLEDLARRARGEVSYNSSLRIDPKVAARPESHTIRLKNENFTGDTFTEAYTQASLAAIERPQEVADESTA